ncbi:unnamed protein product, partial [Closterium sp. NIES-53]
SLLVTLPINCFKLPGDAGVKAFAAALSSLHLDPPELPAPLAEPAAEPQSNEARSSGNGASVTNEPGAAVHEANGSSTMGAPDEAHGVVDAQGEADDHAESDEASDASDWLPLEDESLSSPPTLDHHHQHQQQPQHQQQRHVEDASDWSALLAKWAALVGSLQGTLPGSAHSVWGQVGMIDDVARLAVLIGGQPITDGHPEGKVGSHTKGTGDGEGGGGGDADGDGSGNGVVEKGVDGDKRVAEIGVGCGAVGGESAYPMLLSFYLDLLSLRLLHLCSSSSSSSNPATGANVISQTIEAIHTAASSPRLSLPSSLSSPSPLSSTPPFKPTPPALTGTATSLALLSTLISQLSASSSHNTYAAKGKDERGGKGGARAPGLAGGSEEKMVRRKVWAAVNAFCPGLGDLVQWASTNHTAAAAASATTATAKAQVWIHLQRVLLFWIQSAASCAPSPTVARTVGDSAIKSGLCRALVAAHASLAAPKPRAPATQQPTDAHTAPPATSQFPATWQWLDTVLLFLSASSPEVRTFVSKALPSRASFPFPLPPPNQPPSAEPGGLAPALPGSVAEADWVWPLLLDPNRTRAELPVAWLLDSLAVTMQNVLTAKGDGGSETMGNKNSFGYTLDVATSASRTLTLLLSILHVSSHLAPPRSATPAPAILPKGGQLASAVTRCVTVMREAARRLAGEAEQRRVQEERARAAAAAAAANEEPQLSDILLSDAMAAAAGAGAAGTGANATSAAVAAVAAVSATAGAAADSAAGGSDEGERRGGGQRGGGGWGEAAGGKLGEVVPRLLDLVKAVKAEVGGGGGASAGRGKCD